MQSNILYLFLLLERVLGLLWKSFYVNVSDLKKVVNHGCNTELTYVGLDKVGTKHDREKGIDIYFMK